MTIDKIIYMLYNKTKVYNIIELISHILCVKTWKRTECPRVGHCECRGTSRLQVRYMGTAGGALPSPKHCGILRTLFGSADYIYISCSIFAVDIWLYFHTFLKKKRGSACFRVLHESGRPFWLGNL